ncbi:Pycsar system effector family protein [Micromonospora sp. NPDC051300]|uniref:Pycsar system effector family protein n=1 Tax=Micromonospora sp. NPDC051300 TaxID=3364286 RepID=UPI00378844E0
MMPDESASTATYVARYHDDLRRFGIAAGDGHTVQVDLAPAPAASSTCCTRCGTTYRDVAEDQDDELLMLARAGGHAAACGRDTVTTALDAEIATVRAELSRIDPKAAGYLQMAGVLLGAGLAVLGGAGAGGHLSPAALAAGAVTAVVVLAAVLLLLLASRPHLGGDFGFVSYADADTAQDVLTRVTGGDADRVAPMTPLARARELLWLSRTVAAKYRSISRAAPLLLLGYAGAAVTVALAIWVR